MKKYRIILVFLNIGYGTGSEQMLCDFTQPSLQYSRRFPHITANIRVPSKSSIRNHVPFYTT
jgi:hypothetical protein